MWVASRAMPTWPRLLHQDEVAGVQRAGVPVDGGAVGGLLGGDPADVDAGGGVGGLGEPGAVVAVGAGGAPHVRFAELRQGEVDDFGHVAGDGGAGAGGDAAGAAGRGAGGVHAVGDGFGDDVGLVGGAVVVAEDGGADRVEGRFAVAQVAAGGGDGVVGVVGVGDGVAGAVDLPRRAQVAARNCMGPMACCQRGSPV